MAKTWGTVLVGQFALGLALSSPVFLFSNLSLRTVLATDVKNEHGLATFFRLRFLLSLLALLFVSTLSIFAGAGSGGILIIILVALLKFVESFSDLSFGALQQTGDLRVVGVSMGAKSIFSFILVFVMFRNGAPVWLVLAAILLAWLAVFLFFDFPRAKKSWWMEVEKPDGGVRKCFHFLDWRRSRKLLRLTLPLGFVSALVSLDANIPRYIVKGFQGTGELGIYAGIGFIIIAGNNLVISLCQAVIARLARYHESGQRGKYLKIVFQMVAGAFLFCGLGAVGASRFGSPLLQLVYSPEYAGRESLFAILVFGAGFGYSALILQYATTAARRYSIQILVYSISGSVTLVSCLLLTRSLGTDGAAFGRAAGWMVQFFLLLFLILRDRTSRHIPEEAS